MVIGVTELACQLLRIGTQRLHLRVEQRLGVAGQAQHQGIQRPLQRLATLFRALSGEAFAHLIKRLGAGSPQGGRPERQAEHQQTKKNTHGEFTR